MTIIVYISIYTCLLIIIVLNILELLTHNVEMVLKVAHKYCNINMQVYTSELSYVTVDKI